MGKPDLGALIAQTMNPPPQVRSIEVITGEIVELKKQAGEAILGIGQRLIEAKEMLPHGEWLPWLTERVEFSERTAQNFIRLAREWSNPQALADLGATKALTLLALPPEEREQFIEDHNVIDMSTRQLEQAIKERDEARAAAQRAEADKRTAEQARAKMAEDMGMLNASLASAQDAREQAMQDVARLEAELADLKAQPVDVAVETVVDQAAIDQARAEAVAEMQAKLDKAREKQKKAEAQRQEIQDQLEAARRKLEEQAKAEKRENLAGDKEWAQFELLFNQAKDHANQMLELLFHARSQKNQDTAQIMEKALMALSEQIGRCAK